MHECFDNHDIRVFRDPYLSSMGESQIAAIAKKKNYFFIFLGQLQKNKIKHILLPFETLKVFNLIRWLTERTSTSSYLQSLPYSQNYIVFNNFKINVLITGCSFTTSTIKWQWNVYFTAYSNCSVVKPFKPVTFLLMIFFCFTSPLCISNSATSKNKEYSWQENIFTH